ncbi:MAG TPA: phosphatase PAP2 family protein [Thermoleophilaceae bacterium]|nr:phosphatase PAP2 family protein [Thermoleophilaceae bacterium]
MKALRRFELALLRALRTRGHGPRVERAVLLFTRAGEHGALWQGACLLGAVVDGERRPLYLRTMRTVMLAYLANIGLKYVVRRPRPALEGLPALSSTVTSLSFPSAHSTTSFAAAWALTRPADGLPVIPVYALAKAMAVSRGYVGVHYPTDIAAGAAFGTAIAALLDGR